MNKKESIWDLAVRKNAEPKISNQGEKTIIFAGSKGSGKSTIIQKFLDRNEIIKETLALEYNFGRKSGRSLTKEICHVWELGGGTLFLNLLDLKLGKNSKSTTLFLVLDLSSPETMWNILESILVHVYNFYKKNEMEDFSWDPSGTKVEGVTPFPVPLVIVGGKYDVFQSFDSEKRKLICRTLRCVAHSISASIIFYSDRDALLIKKLKDVLHCYGFGGNSWKGHCTDFDRPLLIHAGSDSFDEIGIGKGSIPMQTRGLPLENFKHTFTMTFPQSAESLSIPDDPVKDVNFKEPVIDSLRAQKDEELDRFLLENEQRRKLSADLAL